MTFVADSRNPGGGGAATAGGGSDAGGGGGGAYLTWSSSSTDSFLIDSTYPITQDGVVDYIRLAPTDPINRTADSSHPLLVTSCDPADQYRLAHDHPTRYLILLGNFVEFLIKHVNPLDPTAEILVTHLVEFGPLRQVWLRGSIEQRRLVRRYVRILYRAERFGLKVCSHS